MQFYFLIFIHSFFSLFSILGTFVGLTVKRHFGVTDDRKKSARVQIKKENTEASGASASERAAERTWPQWSRHTQHPSNIQLLNVMIICVMANVEAARRSGHLSLRYDGGSFFSIKIIHKNLCDT